MAGFFQGSYFHDVTDASNFTASERAAVEKQIAIAPLVVYSKTFCTYCNRLKALLKASGVTAVFVEINLDERPLAAQSVLYALTKQTTVPNVFLGGAHIGGNSHVQALAKSGELAALLEAEGIEHTIDPHAIVAPPPPLPSALLCARYALLGARCYGLLGASGAIVTDLSDWNNDLWYGSNALFVLLDSYAALGARRAAGLLTIVAIVSFAVEQWGVSSGAIFGAYDYGEKLGPKLGHVPFVIPCSWWMYFYAAHSVVDAIARPGLGAARALRASAAEGGDSAASAEHFVGADAGPDSRRAAVHAAGARKDGVARAVALATLDAFATTAIDLYVDPLFARDGFWTWLDPSERRPYFGVPLRNFVGWFSTAFLISVLFRVLLPARVAARDARATVGGGEALGVSATLRAWAPALPLAWYASEALFAAAGGALPNLTPLRDAFTPAEAATLRLIAAFTTLPWALFALVQFASARS
jgi:uncharacterized membrane protein/glutaredoxin